jgi:uncharacterized protein
MDRTLWLVLLAALTLAEPIKAADPQTKPSRILMLTQSKGFQHHAVNREGAEYSVAELAMRELGIESGLFRVDATQDAEQDFRRENLDNYDVVMFYTTGHLPIRPADMGYFLNVWLKTKGHGFIGFHSATDTYGDFPPYREMIPGMQTPMLR